MSWDFPYKAEITRYNGVTYVPVYRDVGCDMQPFLADKGSFTSQYESFFFQTHFMSFNLPVDVRFGDRVNVNNGEQFIIKRANKLPNDGGIDYVECRAHLNTLLKPEYQTTVYRIENNDTRNYDSILDEFYGDSVVTKIPYTVNIDFFANYGVNTEWKAYGFADNLGYLFFTDKGDEFTKDDIVEYKKNVYRIHQKFQTEWGIAIVGLSTLNNDIINKPIKPENKIVSDIIATTMLFHYDFTDKTKISFDSNLGVSLVEDISGNSNYAIQNTTVLRPLYNGENIVFTSPQSLSFTEVSIENCTLFFVCDPSTFPIIKHSVLATDTITFGAASIDYVGSTFSFGDAIATKCIYRIQTFCGKTRAFRNSYESDSLEVEHGIISYLLDTIASVYSGNVYEIIAYNGQIEEQEVVNIERSLSEKFNIPLWQ